MKVDALLKLIPKEIFRELAVETKVDAQVKKLPTGAGLWPCVYGLLIERI